MGPCLGQVEEAWAQYDEICEGETMERVWAKLEDIARIVIDQNGDNDNDEGKKAGARKRVARERAQLARDRARVIPEESGSDESDGEAESEDEDEGGE